MVDPPEISLLMLGIIATALGIVVYGAIPQARFIVIICIVVGVLMCAVSVYSIVKVFIAAHKQKDDKRG